MSKYKTSFIIFLSILMLSQSLSAIAGPQNLYTKEEPALEKSILYKKEAINITDKEKESKKRQAWVESERGGYSKSSTLFYFSNLYTNLGEIAKEQTLFDKKGRPTKSSQIIHDPAYPDISQQRLLSNIIYNTDDKPLNFKEEIFITAKDYLTDTIVRFFSTMDIYKVQYNDSGEPITILGNTEVVISDDKGNTLLTIKGSFTKRAKCDINGKIAGYYRYGIDNVVVAKNAGEIIVSAPPVLTDTEDVNEYRVGIVSIKDQQALYQILNSQSFINQLLAKFGLADLFYKAFYTEKFYTSLSYLQIENTPEEIMCLENITLAFKDLIAERQKAFTLFQSDVDAYYEKLAKTLFENTNLWWNKGISPQEYYAGDDKILNKQEYRKMIDDAIVSLSSKADTFGAVANLPQKILSLEQYLRAQMIMNSKLIYIQNLKNAVSEMNKEMSLAMQKLDRPVLIHRKNAIEALLILPEKAPRTFNRRK